MRRERSVDADWFEQLYAEQGDPWGFDTSPYERAKYDHTLAALPAARFGHALEVGCANGTLTERLAARCDRLLAVDVSDTALARAAARLDGRAGVSFEKRVLPGDAPEGPFDLVLLSEVAYYWDRDDLALAGDWLGGGAVASGGHVLLVHWTGDTDYPVSGDEAVGLLRARLGARAVDVLAERRETYRLDLWRLN